MVSVHSFATNYTVSTKTDLQQRMANALPGDTVVVKNGTYNFGQIIFANNNGTNNSNWIVLKAETTSGVIFTGNTYLQFSGRRIHVTGFKFAMGNTGAVDVIQFRTSSSNLAYYSRLSNITIDQYNSDSTGSVAGTLPDIDNKWVSIYGTNNRVDHCTFIQKNNAGATVTVWYDNSNYPQPSTSTYHTIDSNYFNGRGYLGDNGGETIRVGTSTTSRTDGFNEIAYNVFENCKQTEPEIISNKSDFNTYYANTFRNCNGGLTLRHGRYCKVFSNFFIVNDASVTRAYGIRVIDKGHVIVNNYFEGLTGNRNSLTSARCPIILYNGLSSTNDTINASKASGYFPADSTIVAFNTIVNCSGGAGIVIGYTDGGDNQFQPKGIIIANNLVRMLSGQAAFIDPVNTQLTYAAEGNIIQATNGVGLANSTGFTTNTIVFGLRQNNLLLPPNLVQDAAVNSSYYFAMLQNKDAFGITRTNVFDVGSVELNGLGNVLFTPLDSNQVGAEKPLQLLSSNSLKVLVNVNQFNVVNLSWHSSNNQAIHSFIVEQSIDGLNFSAVATSFPNLISPNSFSIVQISPSVYYRIKALLINGGINYSKSYQIQLIQENKYSVFPNPAQAIIYLKSNGNSISNLQMQLTNIVGRICFQAPIYSNLQVIPIHQFKSGIYTFQVFQNHQMVFSQLVQIHQKK